MTTHNNDRLIRLPIEDSKSNYLHGFWHWVELLAADDYAAAAEALYKVDGWTWDPEVLRERITTFYGGPDPWSVVIPNDRLVKQINDAAEFEPRNNKEDWGWLLAHIPLTTEPEDPKNDEILLMGLACSFYIREHAGSYVMEYEIFHL